MDNSTLQQQLAIMKREILNLKTAAKVAPIIQAYTKSVTLAAGSSAGHAIITYADGTQPIITEAFRDKGYNFGCILGQVSGNTQHVFTNSLFSSDLIVTSTRPIISIEPA